MKVKELIAPLAMMLANHERISIPQSAKLFDASEEDILEALEILVFCFDAVDTRLEFSATCARLYENGPQQMLRLTERQTTVLIEALEHFGIDCEHELVAKLVQAKGYFAGNDGRAASPDETEPAAAAQSPLPVLLARACEDEEHHLLAIEYRNSGATDTQERIVEPCTIIALDGHLYLRCFLHENGAQRSLRLDRMKSARILDACFKPRAWAPEKPKGKQVRIAFAPGALICEWPHITSLEEQPDGNRIVEVTWLGSKWLPKQVVAQMGQAKPLDPPEFVDAVRAYAQELLDATSQSQSMSHCS